MKGRSNRIPAPSAASEDWGDGSWTVDCSCGVNFDDGEKMVNCDVCGVWVHTRCSRYVESEVSFACDKCKGRKRQRGSSVGPHAESNGHFCGGDGNFVGFTNNEETEVAELLAELPTKTDHCLPPTSNRNPGFKLWTRAPIEERVHIQGIPGGDPALFKGLSSVFTSELWKCTGYVAKKFNFKYREFPCWEEEDEGENPANRGADLLFSLSKDIPRFPVESIQYGEIRKKIRKDRKIQGNGGVVAGRSQAFVKKERSKTREAGFSSGKRKESSGVRDLHSVKKKPRSSVEKSSDENRRKGSLLQDENFKPNNSASDLLKTASEAEKNGMLSEVMSSNLCEDPVNIPNPKDILVPESCQDHSANKLPLNEQLVELPCKAEVCNELVGPKIEISQDLRVGEPVKEEAEDFSHAIIEERTDNEVNGSIRDTDEKSSCGSLIPEKQTPGSVDMRNSSSTFVDPAVKDSASLVQFSSLIKLEEEVVGENRLKSDQSEFPPLLITDDKLGSKEPSCMNVVSNGEVKGSPSGGKKLVEDELNCMAEGVDLKNHGLEHSMRGKAEECSLQSLLLFKHEERVKSVPVGSACSVSTESKPVLSAGKSILLSSTQKVGYVSGATSKSPASITTLAGEKAMTKERIKVKNAVPSIPAEEKQLMQSFSKNSVSSRGSQSFSKHVPTESKEKRPHGDEKLAHLESGQKTEKIRLPISHLSSVSFNNSSSGVNTSSALSDEELARLLHQELNSSPRVPRIPRMRQADGLHSSSGGTSSSMLSKCSGGKDQIQASRRKSKEDSPRDRCRSSYAPSGETKRGDRSSWSKNLSLDSAVSQAHTLPGLIDEIMTRGYCRTYEELCGAVLPYWKNLRKPNGDKYAYSSHSQAVLDCLRNRSQWAHLIDRGPKTNSSRKMSSPSPDSNPDDSSTDDDDSHSRNRRRLVLHGRVLRNRSGSLLSQDDDRRRLAEDSATSDSD